jgi:hypothetical protein
MSIHLINSWHTGRSCEHMPIDDLQSFLWLLIWCIYCIIEDKVLDDELDGVWLGVLSSPSVTTHWHLVCRGSILQHLFQVNEFDNVILGPLERLFQPLVLDWHKMLLPAQRDVIPLLESTPRSNEALHTATRKHVGEFLTKGFHHLATLPDSWDSFIPVRVSSVCSREAAESTIVSCSLKT